MGLLMTREELVDQLHRAKLKNQELVAKGLIGKSRTSRRLVEHYERVLRNMDGA